MSCKRCGKEECPHCPSSQDGVHVSINLGNNKIGCKNCGMIRTLTFPTVQAVLDLLDPGPKKHKKSAEKLKS